MRTMTGVIVAALGLAAQPAFAGSMGAGAGEGAAPAALASLPTATIAAASTAIALAPAAAVANPVPAADPFRLGVLTATAAARPLLGLAHGADGALQRRLAGAMFDFFPVAGSGFHLSAGTRLFQRRNILGETEASAGGIMAGPRATSSATTYRAGFKKFNPAVTAGYSLAVSRLAQVGLEAGALMGAAYTNTPGLARFAAGYRSEHEFRPNGIVRLAFASRF